MLPRSARRQSTGADLICCIGPTVEEIEAFLADCRTDGGFKALLVDCLEAMLTCNFLMAKNPVGTKWE